MVYGNSMIKLRFYGPWGEEQLSEKYISVPYNFVPLNQLEYTLTAGVIEDNNKARFMRANLNYGLGRRITVGGGLEYLSSLSKGKIMPYIHASMRIASNVMLSAEHVYGVKSKTVLNYRSSSNIQADLSYTRFTKNQRAVRMDFLEEKKLVMSVPIRTKKFNAFTRLTVNQFILFYPTGTAKDELKYTTAELLFSGVIKGISTNLTSYAVFNKKGNPLVYSNLSLNFRLPGGFRLNPQAQYEYSQHHFSKVKLEVEKNIFMRGFANLSFERNFTGVPGNIVTLGLRYNFSFAQTFFSASKDKNVVRTVQSARGSLIYDAKTNHLEASNQTQIGKGGIIVRPFLDLNCNGERDEDEPGAAGLKININGGIMDPDVKDSIIRVSSLEAYTSYYVELDKNSFENIAWQIKKPTIKVVVDPNQFKLIEVPITVASEVSGTVKINNNNSLSGQGRIIVNILDSENQQVAKVITEQDGYFSYMGLKPGKYTVQVDRLQLEKLNLKSDHKFEIRVGKSHDGEVIDNLQFILTK
jgi:outer membrane usher protein FimD/PapC